MITHWISILFELSLIDLKMLMIISKYTNDEFERVMVTSTLSAIIQYQMGELSRTVHRLFWACFFQPFFPLKFPKNYSTKMRLKIFSAMSGPGWSLHARISEKYMLLSKCSKIKRSTSAPNTLTFYALPLIIKLIMS